MTPRPIKLLHIEDDPMQRLLVEEYLKAITELNFQIVYAESESAAIEEFSRGGIEFVLLDYHLSEGDGLGTLRKLRRRDPVVPVVVVSGAASPEVTAELLRFGADDYLSKRDLNSNVLAQSIRTTLRRAEEWRSRRLAKSS